MGAMIRPLPRLKREMQAAATAQIGPNRYSY